MHGLQVGYFHGYLDGVDYVFVDHACFQGRQGDIYGGDRQSIQFRCGQPAPRNHILDPNTRTRTHSISTTRTACCPAIRLRDSTSQPGSGLKARRGGHGA